MVRIDFESFASGATTRSFGDPLATISQSYRKAVDAQGAGSIFVYAAGIAIFVLFVRWASRRVASDAEKNRLRLREERAAHDELLRPLIDNAQKRQWVRVPAHLSIRVIYGRAKRFGNRPLITVEQTRDIGGGGVSYFTLNPPAIGMRLELAIDLGGKAPLHLVGHVVRLEPPANESAPSLVAVELHELAPNVREQLAGWVARQQQRRIVTDQRKRDGLCLRCGQLITDAQDPPSELCKRCEPELELVEGLAMHLPRNSKRP